MAESNGSRLTWGEAALFWTMVVASFVLVFGVAVLPDCRRSMALERRLAEMRQSNEDLAARLHNLENEKLALEKDPFYVEKLARRTMNLRRPGEKVVLSLVTNASAQEPQEVKPNNPPGSVLYEVTGRLEPLATNGALRLMAVVLALANLLTAFVLFGRDDAGQSAGSYTL